MVRSKWKLFFVDKGVFDFYEKEQTIRFNPNSNPFLKRGRHYFYVENRSSLVTDLAIDKKAYISNGLKYEPILITESQVGMKFGSLMVTKSIGKKMHLYNKVQKKQSEKKRTLKQKKANRHKLGKKAKLKMRSQRLKQMRAKLKAKKKKEI